MRSVLACGLVLALAQLGCDPPPPPPGDQTLGFWDFRARRPLQADAGLDLTPAGGLPICKLEDATGFDGALREFEFTGTFSRCSGKVETPLCPSGSTGRVFFTTLGVDRDAGSDGQYAWLEPMTVERTFSACVASDGGSHVADGGPCVTLTETMAVALFSVSQTLATSAPFRCPLNALDGGVPPPDGGVVAPSFETGDFDAVNACGDLTELVRVNPECRCARNGPSPGGQCALFYRLWGVRE